MLRGRGAGRVNVEGEGWMSQQSSHTVYIRLTHKQIHTLQTNISQQPLILSGFLLNFLFMKGLTIIWCIIFNLDKTMDWKLEDEQFSVCSNIQCGWISHVYSRRYVAKSSLHFGVFPITKTCLLWSCLFCTPLWYLLALAVLLLFPSYSLYLCPLANHVLKCMCLRWL